MKLRLILSLALLSVSSAALADCYVGEVQYFPYNFTPRDYLPANGQLLPINQYQALFSLLGTQFGGDGRTNFALPKITPVTAGASAQVTVKPFVCLVGIYPSRD
jgi:microcystin-dependent protein